MIQAITIINHVGDSIELTLNNPYTTGMAITKIEGIGPGKSDIITNDYPLSDGAVFNMSRLSTRNIVFTLKLLAVSGNSNLNTIEKVRHEVYKYFPVKRPIWMVFETDTRNVKIQGYVESDEPDIFSDWETVTISIICPYPYFEDADTVTTTTLNATNTTITYDGEMDVGVDGEITFTSNVSTSIDSHLMITDNTTNEFFKIDLNKLATSFNGISFGNKLEFSTNSGEKHLHFIKGSTTYNVINCLDRDSSWFQLLRGNNSFTVSKLPTGNYATIKFVNRILYEGI